MTINDDTQKRRKKLVQTYAKTLTVCANFWTTGSTDVKQSSSIRVRWCSQMFRSRLWRSQMPRSHRCQIWTSQYFHLRLRLYGFEKFWLPSAYERRLMEAGDVLGVDEQWWMNRSEANNNQNEATVSLTFLRFAFVAVVKLTASLTVNATVTFRRRRRTNDGPLQLQVSGTATMMTSPPPLA